MMYLAHLFLILVYQIADSTFTSEYGVFSFHYPDEGVIKEPVIFNISQDINEGHFSFEREAIKQVVTDTYRVLPGFSCFEVLDGRDRVWKSQGTDIELESIGITRIKEKLVHVYLWFKEADGRNASILFVRNRDTWELMKSSLSENDSDTRSSRLRVDHVDEGLFAINKGTEGKLQSLEITPKTEHEVKTVLTKTGQMWHSFNDVDVCKKALVYFTEEKPVIAKLDLENEGKPFVLFFLFDENRWDNIHKNRYDVSLKYLKQGLDFKKRDTRDELDTKIKNILAGKKVDAEERYANVELNVSDVDRSLFYVRDRSKGGHRVISYSPRKGNHVARVFDKSGDIWDGEGTADHCTQAILHFDANETLCELKVMAFDDILSVYKINKGNQWENIEGGEFEKKIKELEKKEEEAANL